MSQSVSPIPEGYHTITPSLVCRNAQQALEFYKNAFGAESRGVFTDDSQRVMHAEVKIGDSIVMLTEEYPEHKVLSPQSIGGTGTTLHIYTQDPDAMFNRAVAAGATVKMPMMDAFWGDRYGQVQDPSGHLWSIAARKRVPSREEMQEGARKAFAAWEKKKSAGV